jgi:hypothetical protein
MSLCMEISVRLEFPQRRVFCSSTCRSRAIRDRTGLSPDMRPLARRFGDGRRERGNRDSKSGHAAKTRSPTRSLSLVPRLAQEFPMATARNH